MSVKINIPTSSSSQEYLWILERLKSLEVNYKDKISITCEQYTKLKIECDFYITELRKIMELGKEERRERIVNGRKQSRKIVDRQILVLENLLLIKKSDLNDLQLPSTKELESKLNQRKWARVQYSWRSGPNVNRNLEIIWISKYMKENKYTQPQILNFLFYLFYLYDFDDCRKNIDSGKEIPDDINVRLRDVLNKGY